MSQKHTDDNELNDSDLNALFKADLSEPDAVLDRAILTAARDAQAIDDNLSSRSGFSHWQAALVGCVAVMVLTVVLVPTLMHTSEPAVELSSSGDSTGTDRVVQMTTPQAERRASSSVTDPEDGQVAALNDKDESENVAANQLSITQKHSLASAPSAALQSGEAELASSTKKASEANRIELTRSKASTLAETLSGTLTQEKIISLQSDQHEQREQKVNALTRGASSDQSDDSKISAEKNVELAPLGQNQAKRISDQENNNTERGVQYRSTQLLWIAEIERLYSVNKIEKSLDELEKFRLAHPNSQYESRLPVELKALDVNQNTNKQ